MLAQSKAFSGFAVDDIEKAREFYGDTLGLEVEVTEVDGLDGPGLLNLKLAGDRATLVYPKPDFEPATYTILNFPVDDVEATVDGLSERGVDLRALRGRRAGREGHFPRHGTDHRLVQGPGGQRARRDRGGRLLADELEVAAAVRAGGFEAVEQRRAVERGVGPTASAAPDPVEILDRLGVPVAGARPRCSCLRAHAPCLPDFR